MVDISALEFLWVALNTLTLAFTITALFDARADRVAVRALNGKARELAAAGIVRREGIRVVVQALLLAIAVPALFSARETTVSPFLVVFMAIPVLLLASSVWDARERKAMTLAVVEDAAGTKSSTLTRIEEKLDRNTEVSTEAVVEAKRAYVEANNLNERMSAQDVQIATIGEQGVAVGERIEETVEDTAAKVTDLHAGTAPKSLRP